MDSREVSHISRIRRGYAAFFRQILRVLAFLLLIALTAAAAAFPLWYWAIHGGQSFTWTVLGVLTASLVYLSVKRLRISARSEGLPVGEILKRPLLRFLRLGITLLLLYGTAVLFASSHAGLGIPALLGSLYLIGLLFFR
jgi:hypothetical protein